MTFPLHFFAVYTTHERNVNMFNWPNTSQSGHASVRDFNEDVCWDMEVLVERLLWNIKGTEQYSFSNSSRAIRWGSCCQAPCHHFVLDLKWTLQLIPNGVSLRLQSPWTRQRSTHHLCLWSQTLICSCFLDWHTKILDINAAWNKINLSVFLHIHKNDKNLHCRHKTMLSHVKASFTFVIHTGVLALLLLLVHLNFIHRRFCSQIHFLWNSFTVNWRNMNTAMWKLFIRPENSLVVICQACATL